MSHGPHPAWWAADPGWSAGLVEPRPLSWHREMTEHEVEAAWTLPLPAGRPFTWYWPSAMEARAERQWRADWAERLRVAIIWQAIGQGLAVPWDFSYGVAAPHWSYLPATPGLYLTTEPATRIEFTTRINRRGCWRCRTYRRWLRRPRHWNCAPYRYSVPPVSRP